MLSYSVLLARQWIHVSASVTNFTRFLREGGLWETKQHAGQLGDCGPFEAQRRRPGDCARLRRNFARPREHQQPRAQLRLAALVSATGNITIITLDHMRKIMNNALVRSIGHFDNGIDLAGLDDLKGMKVHNNKLRKTYASSALVTV